MSARLQVSTSLNNAKMRIFGFSSSYKRPSKFSVWFFGQFHQLLKELSLRYVRWRNIPHDLSSGIFPLPFGLILKGTTNVRFEEVVAMRRARTAGVPAPKVISYGEITIAHPFFGPLCLGSILMTWMPGELLGDAYASLDEMQISNIKSELQQYITLLRGIQNPWSPRLCSPTGSAVLGHRFPGGKFFGPCNDGAEFHTSLRQCIFPNDIGDPERSFEDVLRIYERILATPHPVVFTHGDLWHHNILVKDGHITAILDWETAGWLPDYWEFTSVMRFQWREWWWTQFIREVFDGKYVDELASERALWKLTSNW